MRFYRVATIFFVGAALFAFRLLVLSLALVPCAYFLPTLLVRKLFPMDRASRIFVINSLGGWLLFPWIITLVMAFKLRKREAGTQQLARSSEFSRPE